MVEKIDRASFKPRLVSADEASQLHSDHPELSVVDRYAELLEELFLLRHPKYRFDKNYQADLEKFLIEIDPQKNFDAHGSWFYYPWLNAVIHFFPEDWHTELRTGRNRFLITAAEQEKYYNASVAVFGMSVGSHAALTIAMTGGAKYIKLADLDTISGSNLNRIRTGFQNIGLPKVFAVARQIAEINPYAQVEVHSEGVTEENLEKILLANPKVNVLVEEMDNPYLKLKARYIARANDIPVVMAADNGDGVIADVERFDLDPKLPILHGIMGNITPEDVKNVPPQELPKVIAKMAGADMAHLRMLESVGEVGKSIYSWPQLGTAANLCGTVLAYLARRVILKDNIPSGRRAVNLDAIFEGDYSETEQAGQRKAMLKKLAG